MPLFGDRNRFAVEINPVPWTGSEDLCGTFHYWAAGVRLGDPWEGPDVLRHLVLHMMAFAKRPKFQRWPAAALLPTDLAFVCLYAMAHGELAFETHDAADALSDAAWLCKFLPGAEGFDGACAFLLEDDVTGQARLLCAPSHGSGVYEAKLEAGEFARVAAAAYAWFVALVPEVAPRFVASLTRGEDQ